MLGSPGLPCLYGVRKHFCGGTYRDQQLECVHLKLLREVENQSEGFL